MQFKTQRGKLSPYVSGKPGSPSRPLEDKTASETGAALDVLNSLLQAAQKTVAFDNGSEFQDHQKLEAVLNLEPHFCDPYSPWQRGTTENTNGIYTVTYQEKRTL